MFFHYATRKISSIAKFQPFLKTSVFSTLGATLKYKKIDISKREHDFPVDTGRKLNVHKTFRRHPGRLLYVLCMSNLRPLSTGFCMK